MNSIYSRESTDLGVKTDEQGILMLSALYLF